MDLTVSDAGVMNKAAYEEESEKSSSVKEDADLDKIKKPFVEIKQRFVEDPEQIPDCYEYSRLGSDPGLIVIFNQQRFDGEFKDRIGTNRDVNELILTFGRLGYNIDRKYIFNDLTREEIMKELNDLSEADHSNRNSLIVAVLTHGDSGNELRAKDASVYANEIWECFSASRCVTLKDKPKLFIFQACKGQRFSQHDATEVDVISNNIYKTHMEPDMLVAFAAVEGSQSYRHMYNGTWFIQEMCRNFSAFGRRDDVVSLLIRTTKCVATNYYHISHDPTQMSAVKVKKQMPLFVSTLKKKFYLTKSKDRNLMLQILQGQEEMAKTLEDVKQKVDAMYEDFQKKKKTRKSATS